MAALSLNPRYLLNDLWVDRCAGYSRPNEPAEPLGKSWGQKLRLYEARSRAGTTPGAVSPRKTWESRAA